MNEFKAGDVVRLKSGGTKMTVGGKVALTDELTCYWFHVTQHEFRKENIPSYCLKLDQESQ